MGESSYVYSLSATLLAFTINPIQLIYNNQPKDMFSGSLLDNQYLYCEVSIPFNHSTIYKTT
jgi:hypothetical protein